MPRLFPSSPAMVLSLVCCMAAAGCGHGSITSQELLNKYPTQIYSMTGEPLNGGRLGRPKCEDAQAAWLDRVDTDHDGTIDLEELLAESRRQFAVMNIDHSGQLTADQLEVYRAPYSLNRESAPKPPADGSQSDEPQTDGEQAEAPRGGGPDHAQGRAANGGGPRPAASQPDPVLAADSNLDFEVSLQEFMIQQRENFRQLDKNHDQRLSADELNILCHIRERAAIH